MTIVERKDREKEKRRNDIIDAAEKVFFSGSAADATMDDIAEKAELSKGTLYLYFKSKEDLFNAIVLRSLSYFKVMALEAAGKCQTGLEKLYSMADALYRFQKQYPHHFDSLFQHGFSTIDTDIDSPLEEEMKEKHEDLLQFVITCIRQGIEDGSIRSDIDPYKSAFALQGLVTGLIRMVSMDEDHLMKCHNINSEEVINYAFELVGHALMNPNGVCEKCPAETKTKMKSK